MNVMWVRIHHDQPLAPLNLNSNLAFLQRLNSSHLHISSNLNSHVAASEPRVWNKAFEMDDCEHNSFKNLASYILRKYMKRFQKNFLLIAYVLLKQSSSYCIMCSFTLFCIRS